MESIIINSIKADGDDVDEHNGDAVNSNTSENKFQVVIHFYYSRLQIIFYG